MFNLIGLMVLAHIVLTWMQAIYRGLRARRAAENDIKPQANIEQPPVSILVPAWCERGTIEQCIHSLQKITYPAWEAIILAGGPDGTYEVALQAAAGDNRFRILERGPEPKNVALSRGIEAARHDILVLLDADCIVAPGWLSALVAPLASGASVSLGDCFPKRETWVSIAEQMQNIQMYQITNAPWIQGDRSMAIRRQVLARIGQLPAHAYAREDWDIGVRLAKTGEQIAFARGAWLWTERPATLREFWAREVRWRRTHLAGLWEHRTFALRHPIWFAYQFYFYGFSVLLALATVTGLVASILWPETRPVIGEATALVLLWMCGRRASLGGEVAVYTGEKAWLWRAWAPVVLMFVTIPASIVATLSVLQGTPFDYKGPRVLRTV